MNNININKILEKHKLNNRAKAFSHVANLGDIDDRIRQFIKEIIETVIDKCAEEAEAIEGWDTGFSGNAASVNKNSILAVKTMIDYGDKTSKD